MVIFSIVLCFILMLVGLAGVILPFLPGVPLAWAGLFIYALVTGFDKISVPTVVIFFILMLLTLALDFLAPMLGAGKYRAGKWGIAGVFIGFIVGIFVFGPWGLILGPFLGALVGELIGKRNAGQAIKAAFGAVIGFLAGNLLKIVLIFVMLGFFVSSLF